MKLEANGITINYEIICNFYIIYKHLYTIFIYSFRWM